MKVPYSWIQEFVELDDITPYEAADALTMAGIEVESVEDVSAQLSNCKVGKILKVYDHPNARSLKILDVTVGDGILKIVCGAPNVREGMNVAVALVGAVLPNGQKVEVANIRGVESNGMLLSEIELGLVESTWGVFELPEDAKVGDKVARYVYYDDFVLEVSPTPNRGDCFGVIGIARELSAIFRRRLKYPSFELDEKDGNVEDYINVFVEDFSLCPRYTARYIEGVEVGESPLWIKVRLKLCDMRPISNVVDVTNYVLLELGHPLHAFDYLNIKGGKIIVRKAREGEYIVTLDGEFRELDTDVLVIADEQRPVAIAGIMGGANSEVTSSTTKVLLESAYFDPVTIRRGSKKLALSTEASRRFERGTDIERLTLALDRAAYLISKIAGGSVVGGVVDVYGQKLGPVKIFVESDAIEKLAGVRVPKSDIKEILQFLEFGVDETDKGYEIEVPYHRIHDVKRAVDVVEEVLRIWGYDKIPEVLPKGELKFHHMDSDYNFIMELKSIIKACGYNEIITYSFVNPEDLSALKLPEGDARLNYVKLLNPLSEEMSVMRTTLCLGLLNSISYNNRVRQLKTRFFEIGRVFFGSEEGIRERLHLGISMSGDGDFYELKGVIEFVSESLGVRFRYIPSGEEFLHPGKSADIIFGDRKIGYLGYVHPDVLEKFDIKTDVLIAELDLEDLKNKTRRIQFRPISRYPETVRDISFIIDKSITYEQIDRFIRKILPDTVVNFSLKDVYEGKPIPEGKRSITLSFVFQSYEKTLSDEEIDKDFWYIASAIEKEFSATVRSR